MAACPGAGMPWDQPAPPRFPLKTGGAGIGINMRSMWRGAISFGLVMIPVRLYAATEQRDVSFRQVHRADGGRIKFRRVCSVCGEEVQFGDVAKGYELGDGEVVVLTDEDLADLPLPTAHSIEVVSFTPAEQLDPVLCGRSYFAEPEPAGLRAYALLRDALDRSGRVGIARVALRQRESLAAVRTRDGVLMLETLLWPDEIRDPDFGFLDREVQVRPQELTMASTLIESMTTDFDPSTYRDHYREAVEELVAAKIEGHEVVRAQPAGPEEPAGTLAEALRASLTAAKSGRADGERAVPDAAAGDGGRKRGRDGGDQPGRGQAGDSQRSRGRAGKRGRGSESQGNQSGRKESA